MQITKTFFLTLLMLCSLFLAQVMLINAPAAQAAYNLWDLAEEGGLEEIGEEAYDQYGTPTDLRTVIARIINVFLGFLAIIFLIIILIAGYKWMTSGGNEETVRSAKSWITAGIIGLIIIIIAWSISIFIISNLLKATQ